MSEVNEVLVGEVLKPHGIKGELKVYPLTHDPERFKHLKAVELGHESQRATFKLESVNFSDVVYLKLEGISNRDEAEKYRGWKVYIHKDDVPPLNDGWYYFELEGLHVYEGEHYLGVLKQVIETGANDVYVVQGEKREFCIPALKSVVLNVDVPAKRMEVKLPPGLLD